MADVKITTPCIRCAVDAEVKDSAFFASRGLDWPTVEIAGHVVHKACASSVEGAFENAADGTLVVGEDGIGRWSTNSAAIPHECAVLFEVLGLAPGLDVEATKAAHDRELGEVLARYRANPPQPDAEQLHEMRNAFGPGATVVNVITGQERVV